MTALPSLAEYHRSMPDNADRDRSMDLLDDEAFRAELERLKTRVASLDQRVEALEKKKRQGVDESLPGRS